MRALVLILWLLARTALCQTNQPAPQSSRPFKSEVEAISKKNVAEQYKFVLGLNRTLMSEGFAIFSGKADVPHFGHLARELLAQQEFELMRMLLRKRELSPFNYYTIAELLGEKLDAGAFDLLLTNSSLTMPPPKGEEGYQAGKDIITWLECIPEYSTLSLRHYLNSEVYGPKAEGHLIKILKEHKRTGVRAYAAEALGYSKSPKVIKPLEEAVGDKAEAPCMQCGNDYVGQYAEQALERIRKNP